MKRFKLNGGKSRKMFSRTADRTHYKNSPKSFSSVMRGGIRM